MMQAVVKILAGVAGLQPEPTNLQYLSHLNVKALAFFEAQAELNRLKKVLESQNAVLTPHRNRLDSAIANMQDIYMFNISQEDSAKESTQGVQDIIDDLLHTRENVAAQIGTLETRHQVLAEDMNNRLNDLLQFLQHECKYQEQKEDCPAIELSRNMFPETDLAGIEKDCADFEEFLAEQAKMQNPQPGDEYPFPATEIDEQQDEKHEMQIRFAQLRSRQEELLSDHRFDLEDEVEMIESQINELTQQLAVRGIPIVDGRIVPEPVYDDAEIFSGPIQWQQMEQEAVDQVGSDECKLFDDAAIERPTADEGEGDDVALTQAEVVAHIKKVQARVSIWLDSDTDVLDHKIPASSAEADPESDRISGDVLYDSVSTRLPARHVTGFDRLVSFARSQAWAVQLARDQQETLQRISIETPYIELPPGVKAGGCG